MITGQDGSDGFRLALADREGSRRGQNLRLGIASCIKIDGHERSGSGRIPSRRGIPDLLTSKDVLKQSPFGFRESCPIFEKDVLWRVRYSVLMVPV